MMRTILVFIIGMTLAACTADPALDVEAVEAKAKTGDTKAIAQCVDLLANEDEAVAKRAYLFLVNLGEKATPALLGAIEAHDHRQREYIIAALGTLKVAEAVPLLARVLENKSLGRRYVAAWALGEIGGEAAVPPLLKVLDDRNDEVRRYATRALIKLNRLAVEPLIGYLATAPERGSGSAIRALGDIADPRSLEPLLKQVDGPNRADLYLALGKLRDPRAERVLIDGLSDRDWKVRMNAAMALGPLGGADSVAGLRVTLEDEVHVVREWSARSLEMVTGTPVLYRNDAGDYVRPYNVYH